MTRAGAEDRPELWVERLASLTGATYLADAYLNRPDLGAYLFVLVVAILDLYGLSILGALATGTLRVVADPATNLIVPTILVVTVTTRRLTDRARGVLEGLPERDDDVERVLADNGVDVDSAGVQQAVGDLVARTGLVPELGSADGRVVPPRLKIGVYLIALAFHASWLLTKPPSYYALIDLIGPTLAAVKYYGTHPFFYYLLIAELVSTVIGVHLLLPVAISRDRRIDFADLHDFGGLQPMGRLLKTSAVHLLVLLTLYVVFVALAIGPDIADARHVTIIVGLSGFVVGLFLASAYWLHVHMRRMRAAKLEAIGREFAAAGVDDRLPPDAPGADEDVDAYTRGYIKLARVRETKEYPLDLGIVEELLFALALPYLTHVSMTVVVEYVGV